MSEADAVDGMDPEEPWLTVGEVAKHTGLTIRSLHHYDQLALLRPSGRSASGYRLYSPADLTRLLQIQHLKSLGLRLEEVGAALDVEKFDAAGVLEDHITAVERRIAEEQRLLRTLHALRTPARMGWRDVLSAVEQTERLRHPEPHVRFRAALTSPESVPLEDLVQQLAADPVPGVREALTWAIVRHGRGALPHLVPLLRDKDPVIRAQAAHALSKIGDRSAVDRIAPLLDDTEPTVAAKAARVIGRLGGPAAAQALVDRLGSGPREFDDAITAGLEMIGTEATPLLMDRLGAASARIRAGAAEALGLIGDPVSVRNLVPLLADPEPSVRFEAIVALGQLEGGAATTAITRAVDSSDRRVAHIAERLLSNRRATAASG